MGEAGNTAIGRIASLLDANSFVEIGAGITARTTDFGLAAKDARNDGAVTGYGTVDGSLVYVYAQDPEVLGGTVGEMHARKVRHIYSMAAKMGAPVVAMLDSKGIRIEESSDALSALGSIYRSVAALSGVVPTIAAVYGECGGGLSFIPALSDFVFMAKGAKLFVNSPDAIEGNSADACDTSAADFQEEAGNVDFAGTAEEVAAAMKKLISLLPANNADEGEYFPGEDDPNRQVGNLTAAEGGAAGMCALLADDGDFFETKAGFGKNVVTGFMRLNGQTVGAVACSEEGKLCASCADKAASFINFCDAYGIPVLTLANAASYSRCKCGEKKLPAACARLVNAYAEATVPKVTVVTGSAIGSAGVVMGSKAVGADMVYAYAGAQVSAIDSKEAGAILCAEGTAAEQKKAAAGYAALQGSTDSAVRRGFVDAVIEPADTRRYAIGAFEMLYSKKEDRPEKKHGTIL